jgi:hypothetical protein
MTFIFILHPALWALQVLVWVVIPMITLLGQSLELSAPSFTQSIKAISKPAFDTNLF